MVIACIDIGGTSVKFAKMTKEGAVLEKETCPTPENLEALLAFLDACLAKADYEGIAFSVPGAVNRETGVIEGISAIPYIHGFSWYDKLATYGVPVTLENDANCVGLSELLSRPHLQNLACVVIGTGIGGAIILNGKLHRGRHNLGGEFGYMTLREPDQELHNWSTLASTGKLVRTVREQTGDVSYDGRKVYQEAHLGNPICLESIEQMYHHLALGILNIQYSLDPDVISIGGSISQNEEFIAGVQKKVEEIVNRYPEYSIVPKIVACHYQEDANVYGALVNWLQEEQQW
ncbi:sugar kinase [Streptococcus cuniculi]|uniref:Sugar kinase n=1 Tax=Streptococcus cuniculi TaxID=1432788 RepID=A0A1Q8E7B4_9STRE|nr:ROK family protein [Streptococcus cuniculi]OLF47691.1 sugar kinase [Streptococcus cuniculi]